MRRGELYRVARPHARDPKRFRVFVIVSRQALIDSRFSTIICAPVYSTRHGLATQVDVGLNEGLRHDSSVHCDELVSLRKSQLTQFVGSLDVTKLKCPRRRPDGCTGLLRGERELGARADDGVDRPSAVARGGDVPRDVATRVCANQTG